MKKTKPYCGVCCTNFFFFVGVPNNKLAHVKLLFESTISNISKNSGNKNILDINKNIIQSFNSQIQNLKKNLS